MSRLSKSIKYGLKVSNYNSSCDYVICSKLIEKGDQYFRVSYGKHKYVIHFECHDNFLVWLKENIIKA
jgi:hypothetical protein